eukprot:4150964-Alexandrium_andersonii.AAC.1
MSASLVGSEMCIRDRISGRRAQRAVGLGLPDRVQDQVGLHGIRARDGGCLLYTSDAADDM